VNEDAIKKRIGTLILLTGPLTTLVVSPFSSFDPINNVKLLFVSGTAMAILSFILYLRREVFRQADKVLLLSTVFFVLWMVVVFIFSGAPLDQQFWGVFGRNTGFLTYFSLVVLLLGAAFVQSASFYRKLIEALLITGIPTTLYALIQLAGRDPISWSVMAPFATLGNINFSSAFFGLVSICALILAANSNYKPVLRAALLILVILDMAIVLQTGSIQGVMIFVAGVGIAGFFWIRSKTSKSLINVSYLVFGALGFGTTVLALLNQGPLARFVFSETVSYRFDYWFAGWAMTVKNPILGVGLDSYGDWYRELRGEVATLRTTPDRITNTAHNIYLDLSASGGVPLLMSYLIILALAFRSSWRIIKRTREFDPYFVAIFSTWAAYLIQAAISINQIGVGIWGWLFTGALVGYERAQKTTMHKGARSDSKKSVSSSSKPLPAGAATLGIVASALGFALAFVPYSADAEFKKAFQSGSLVAMENTLERLGSTAYHSELVLNEALKQNDLAKSEELTSDILSRFPRNFMAWQVKQILTSTSPEDRKSAYLRLRQLDPFNPQIQP
jgi:O-antigen ligase